MKARRLLPALMAFLMMLGTVRAEGHLSGEPSVGGEIVRTYISETLEFTIERFTHDGAYCYLTRVWMQDPSRQIEKGTSKWKKNLMYPSEQAKKLPVKAMLVINGSGFVSTSYPWIPEDYPGRNSDYFNTPLGALTVTDGEVMRNLEDVRYYGITLESDGLHMYEGAQTAEVLARNPIHTWSFYDRCVLVRGGESLVDRDWLFSNERNIRTIIGRMSDDTVMILTVTDRTNTGLTLVECADFLIRSVRPLWAFNLDGGPSTALLVRREPKAVLKTVYGNIVKNVDILGFCELPDGGE